MSSKFFGSGNGASNRSMAYWALAIFKEVEKWTANTIIGSSVADVLKNQTRGILAHRDFVRVLDTVLSHPPHLNTARAFLAQYNRTHLLHVISSAFFPSVTDTQIAECRSVVRL